MRLYGKIGLFAYFLHYLIQFFYFCLFSASACFFFFAYHTLNHKSKMSRLVANEKSTLFGRDLQETFSEFEN